MFLENFKFHRRTERDKVHEIEHDLLFQKFHQETIKNFNTIDQKLLLDSQRQQRDVMVLKSEVDDLRRLVKDQRSVNDGVLERGQIEKEIESLKNHTNRKILETETKNMKNITDLNEDMNSKLHSLQDQISNFVKFIL